MPILSVTVNWLTLVARSARSASENNLDFEHRHKTIIDRFGRYPLRNAVLGRAPTPEEQAFWGGPGSSF